jgi:L-alanine-DL-glutamate epimerase-like enolase superfamily enzyme
VKIAEIKSLHADGGGRAFDFLKISTDDGLVGWSEYNQSFGGLGVSAAIDHLAQHLIDKDPRPFEAQSRCCKRCAARRRVAWCSRLWVRSRTRCST